jgi:undecaprenyl-diphosphatase
MQKKYLVIYICIFVLAFLGIFFDNAIVKFIVNNRIDFLNNFMIWITYTGTWFLVLIIMTTLFLWNEKKRKWIIPLWLSVLIAEAIVYLFKFLIFRERPFEALNLINLVQDSDSSFPSGHATAVFASLAVLYKEFPKFVWFWLSFAILVAFSRIYLGVHYLTDVATGAFIGLTIGLLVVFVFEKYKPLEKISKRFF